MFSLWNRLAKVFLLISAAGLAALAIYRLHEMKTWAQLDTFKAANLFLGDPQPSEKRVVFIGDSNIQGWNLAEFFPRKPYINRGINGQTTSQLLVRFKQDVISLKPTAVVILGGINDLNLSRDFSQHELDRIEKNLAALDTEAKEHGVRVVFCAVTPVLRHPTEPMQTADILLMNLQVKALDTWLENYAKEHGDGFADNRTALRASNGFLRADFTNDGWHPNGAAYKQMASLVEEQIGIQLAH
jgi:lysophospholipase L1-like esterase